jgi:hypothetical protein
LDKVLNFILLRPTGEHQTLIDEELHSKLIKFFEKIESSMIIKILLGAFGGSKNSFR